MASFQFRNTKTGETKVVNSKDSATAKRVYSNKTWEYVKAVPRQKSATHACKEMELMLLSRRMVSQLRSLKSEAESYDMRFHRSYVSEMEDILSKMQSILR